MSEHNIDPIIKAQMQAIREATICANLGHKYCDLLIETVRRDAQRNGSPRWMEQAAKVLAAIATELFVRTLGCSSKEHSDSIVSKLAETVDKQRADYDKAEAVEAKVEAARRTGA